MPKSINDKQYKRENIYIRIRFLAYTHKNYYTHMAPKYLDNIVEIFLGNIVRLLKYFETCH